jgi:hypothetical protein
MVGGLIVGLIALVSPWGRTGSGASVLSSGVLLANSVGVVLCCFVPKKSGAHGYIYGTIACNIAGFVLGLVARERAPGIYLAGLFTLAATVLTLMFLKQLAQYRERDDLADTADTLLKYFGYAVALGVVARFIPFIGLVCIPIAAILAIISWVMLVTLQWQLGEDLLG